MKSSHAVVHNKQDGSDSRGSRRSGRWGLNATERRGQALEISIRQIDGPVAAANRTLASIYLQAAAKLANVPHVLSRSKRRGGLSKPRQTSVLLPPICGSRTISGKVERTDAAPAHRQGSAKPKGCRTRLPTGNVMPENAVFRVLVTQGRKVNQASSKYNKISVALAAGDKAAVQDSATRSRLIKRTVDGHPAATAASAPADPPTRQKNDASGPGASDGGAMMPVRAKHDASVCEAGQQRDLCSDDSAIETESEGSGDKGRPEPLKEDSDEDYYTDQRITEWVLTVNSSLFSTENEMKRSKPAEEQDAATIKITYSGD